MQLLLRRRQSPQILNLAALQPLFVIWRWQLQRCPVAPEDAVWHVRVALRPEIATAVVFPAKARRDDQLAQEKHMACDAMLNIAAILTVSMSSRCRQLISAIVIATVSTSGAAARRGCPQRARAMLRTVSEIRGRIGRCFISTNAPASANEAGAPSKRRGEAVVADAKDFIDFWGRRVECSREACRGERARRGECFRLRDVPNRLYGRGGCQIARP